MLLVQNLKTKKPEKYFFKNNGRCRFQFTEAINAEAISEVSQEDKITRERQNEGRFG